MKKIAWVILLCVLLIPQCRDAGPPSDPDPEPSEQEEWEWFCSSFAEEDLHGTWSTPCVEDGGGSFVIELTFSADGGFQRWERTYSEADCTALSSDDTIDKTFTIEGSQDENPCMIKLQYLDVTDTPVYVLYTIDADVLTFAENPDDYPSDLSAGIDYY